MKAKAKAKQPAPHDPYAIYDDMPCPRCVKLYDEGRIRGETVMPLPQGVWAPLARDGSGPCCFDCASAETLLRMKYAPDFVAARICVGNDRQEQFRLAARYGLVGAGLMRPTATDKDLHEHHEWLDKHAIEPGTKFLGIQWPLIDKQFPEASAKWDRFCVKHKLDQTAKITIETGGVTVWGGLVIRYVDADDNEQLFEYRGTLLQTLTKAARDKLKAEAGGPLPPGAYKISADELDVVPVWDWRKLA